jgi:hypothetical protein
MNEIHSTSKGLSPNQFDQCFSHAVMAIEAGKVQSSKTIVLLAVNRLRRFGNNLFRGPGIRKKVGDISHQAVCLTEDFLSKRHAGEH